MESDVSVQRPFSSVYSLHANEYGGSMTAEQIQYILDKMLVQIFAVTTLLSSLTFWRCRTYGDSVSASSLRVRTMIRGKCSMLLSIQQHYL